MRECLPAWREGQSSIESCEVDAGPLGNGQSERGRKPKTRQGGKGEQMASLSASLDRG